MDLPDELFTPILSIPNDENVDIDTNLTTELVTIAPIVDSSPIERALKAVDKYLKENEHGIEDIINGPSVHFMIVIGSLILKYPRK